MGLRRYDSRFGGGWRLSSRLAPAFFIVAFLAIVAAFLVLGGALGSVERVEPLFLVALVALFLGASIAAGYYRRRSIPLPPPVEATAEATRSRARVPVSCPNCGAPGATVDASGIAVCPHCETRFVVS